MLKMSIAKSNFTGYTSIKTKHCINGRMSPCAMPHFLSNKAGDNVIIWKTGSYLSYERYCAVITNFNINEDQGHCFKTTVFYDRSGIVQHDDAHSTHCTKKSYANLATKLP